MHERRLWVVLAVVVSGCGGGSGGGKGPSPGIRPDGDVGDATHEDAGGPEIGHPGEYESDTRDARVPACKESQPFALETCWDRVVWTDDGEVTLEGSAGRLEVVGPGGVIDPKVLALYRPAYSHGDGVRMVSDRIRSLRHANPMRGYWFLPASLTVTKTEAGDPASPAALLDGEWPLASWGYYEGTGTLCRKTLPLPITRADIERACIVEIGDSSSHILKGRRAFVHAQFYATPSDTEAGSVERQRVGEIHIVARLPERGGSE